MAIREIGDYRLISSVWKDRDGELVVEVVVSSMVGPMIRRHLFEEFEFGSEEQAIQFMDQYVIQVTGISTDGSLVFR